MLFGKKIRELRDENGVLQRQLAALLEIDTPMFSKIERGDRRAKREQVIKLAEYFHQDENEMLTLWLPVHALLLPCQYLRRLLTQGFPSTAP